jgi:transketolase
MSQTPTITTCRICRPRRNESESFGFESWSRNRETTLRLGHDTDAIRDAIAAARAVTDKPSMIACKTIIGFGFPTKAGTEGP